MSTIISNKTDVTLPTNENNGSGSSSALIISFEVLFSVAIFAAISMCYFLGIRKRNRLRKAKIEQYENMVERAIKRHEQLLSRRLHQSDSSATVYSNSNINNEPPPYFPRANDPNCPQLLEKDVSRLSEAILATHLARYAKYPLPSPSSSPSSSSASNTYQLPPKYSESSPYHSMSPIINTNNDSIITPPLPLVTRSSSSVSSINHTHDNLKPIQN
ncbi:unnamed protein product [Cunninghamella blakesleeana]